MKTFEEYLTQTGEVGTIEQVFTSLVFVRGLPRVKPQELVIFESGEMGQVLSITNNYVEVVVYANVSLRIGTRVARTEETFQVQVGIGLLGTILDPVGKAMMGTVVKPEGLVARAVDVPPYKLEGRQVIQESLDTGVAVVDLVVPLAKGQRQLILGDGKIGKTPFLRQVVLSHVLRGGVCVYAAIAKRYHELTRLQAYLVEKQIAPSCVVVATNARDTAGLIYQTPYTAMTIAENLRDQGKEVLVILDDLSIHAKYYRELMLMAKRFPGRSAYPGDIFYIHAKLMERAGNFQTGSITCLPVAETVQGDISGYIQTNLMSMTDGHIFFDTELYNQGKRPAINTFLSVTRVGHQAQEPVFKSLSRELSKFLTQYKQTEELLHFGGEMGEDAKKTLSMGDKVKVIFNQEGGLIPKEVAALVLAGLWGGYYGADEPASFQAKFMALVQAYLSDGAYQEQVRQLVYSANSLEELVGVAKGKEELLLRG
jgi:F-type H+-transporting ATPase subunit alpha